MCLGAASHHPALSALSGKWILYAVKWTLTLLSPTLTLGGLLDLGLEGEGYSGGTSQTMTFLFIKN